MTGKLKIGITNCGKFENYRRWIEQSPGTEVVKLSMHQQNLADLSACNGVLFSGGEDLQPGLYGQPGYEKEYGLTEIIPARDDFEYRVLENALSAKMPILGICRGLQLINVYLGGSLIPDIPSCFQLSGHGKKEGIDQVHQITTESGSLLRQISGQESGFVNSAHHQSVDRHAPSLKITSRSDQPVVESMEWANDFGKSWLLLVQWHPERMADPASPFSVLLKNAFLDACRNGSTPRDPATSSL